MADAHTLAAVEKLDKPTVSSGDTTSDTAAFEQSVAESVVLQ